MKQEGVSLGKSFLPLLIQMPLFIAVTVALRHFGNEAELIEGFTSGGTLWFPELHKRDPYFVLPVIQSAFGILAIRV
jgi:membrane protein insertase Oxa1/YidC/SpoIIIJ